MTVVLTVKKAHVKTRNGFVRRFVPPSLNARMHWAVRRRWGKAFADEVLGEMLLQNSAINEITAKREGKARVTIKFYCCQLMDYDNAYSSAKPLLDALKGRAIEDDRPDKLDLKVEQEKVHHLTDQKIEIIIS